MKRIVLILFVIANKLIAQTPAEVLATIDSNIYNNTTHKITGDILNYTLKRITNLGDITGNSPVGYNDSSHAISLDTSIVATQHYADSIVALVTNTLVAGNNISVTFSAPSFTVTGKENAWSAYSVITLTAVTTAPTKATTTEWDSVRYRIHSESNGSTPQTIEVLYIYAATSATGSSAGSGNYLWELPNSYQFDTGEHDFYTGSTDLSNGELAKYAIDVGKPQGIIEGDIFYDFAIIVPYDATHFRVMAMGGNAPDEWVGSGWYPITQPNKVYAFTFIFYAN